MQASALEHVATATEHLASGVQGQQLNLDHLMDLMTSHVIPALSRLEQQQQAGCSNSQAATPTTSTRASRGGQLQPVAPRYGEERGVAEQRRAKRTKVAVQLQRRAELVASAEATMDEATPQPSALPAGHSKVLMNQVSKGAAACVVVEAEYDVCFSLDEGWTIPGRRRPPGQPTQPQWTQWLGAKWEGLSILQLLEWWDKGMQLPGGSWLAPFRLLEYPGISGDWKACSSASGACKNALLIKSVVFALHRRVLGSLRLEGGDPMPPVSLSDAIKQLEKQASSLLGFPPGKPITSKVLAE